MERKRKEENPARTIQEMTKDEVVIVVRKRKEGFYVHCWPKLDTPVFLGIIEAAKLRKSWMEFRRGVDCD